MRTLQRFATVCFISAALAALASACGSSDSTTPAPGTAGATGTAGAPTSTAGAPTSTAGASTGTAGAATGTAGAATTGNATNGAAVYVSASCSGCHGPIGDGGEAPNITGNKDVGIGNWTEAQFHDAVRSATNRKGSPLCLFMVSFNEATISDSGIADVYAYLMTQNSATAHVGTDCTGTCTQFGGCTGTL